MMVKKLTTNQPQIMTVGPPLHSRQEPMEMQSDESTLTAVKQNAKLIRPLKPTFAFAAFGSARWLRDRPPAEPHATWRRMFGRGQGLRRHASRTAHELSFVPHSSELLQG